MMPGSIQPASPHPSRLDPCFPPDALRVAQRYLSALDAAIPGRISAFLVTGSIALGEYRAGSSDLDFVAVSDAPLDERERSKLAAMHRAAWILRSRPSLDGCFATRAQLAADPRGLVVPRVREGIFIPEDDYAANPVAWCTAARHPLSLRYDPGIRIWDDDGVLRTWCRDNLAGYWSSWTRRAGNRFPDSLAALGAGATFWGVTGVSRIHATIATGRIVSKLVSIDLARAAYGPGWDDILDEAAAVRTGTRGPLSGRPFRRRERLLAFMDRVIRDSVA